MMKRRNFIKSIAGGMIAISCPIESSSRHIIKSQVAQADIPNANGRVYPRKVLEKAINDFKGMPKNSMIGQIGMSHDSRVHFASHSVSDLCMSEQNELIADIQVMDTPCGKELSKLIDNGAVAFRLQGTGNVQSVNGVDVIQDDYKIITVNAVLAEFAA